LKRYNPVINDDGEFTTSSVDNRVLTAVTDTMLAGRISLEGKSRDEIIRIFQAVAERLNKLNQIKVGCLGGMIIK